MKRPSKKALVALALALAAGLGILTAVDAQQPAFRLPLLAGSGELTPDELAKGTQIVVVWASWSPRCRDIDEQVAALHSKWRDRATVITVNFQEKPDAIRAALADRKMKVPVYLDSTGAFSKMHAVTTVPHVLVFVDGKRVLGQRLTSDIDQVIASKLP